MYVSVFLFINTGWGGGGVESHPVTGATCLYYTLKNFW
jgi:hypothetical protein